MEVQTGNQNRKLLLIDGNGLAYRSFYAFPVYKSELGLPLNSILGFVNLLFNVIISEKPTHIAVAFDHGAFTEHLLRYRGYNVERMDVPEDLALQLPVLDAFVCACGFKTYRLNGFEADDCLGTLAERASRDGFETIIVAGDLDLLQLVAPHVRVLTTRRGLADSVVYDVEAVRRKFNIDPSQLADLRALSGDSSQNISGVPGIGEVTARRLLSQYGSLDGLFSSLDSLPTKWRTPLLENREMVLDYKNRATIRRDLPLDFTWDDCLFHGVPLERIKRILAKVSDLSSYDALFKRLQPLAIEEEPVLFDEKALSAPEIEPFLAEIAASSQPLSLVWVKEDDVIMGIALALGCERPLYISVGDGENQISEASLWEHLRPIFADDSRPKYVHFLRDVAERASLEDRNVFDVAVVSALVNPTSVELDLESICLRCGQNIYPRDLLLGVPRRPWREIPQENLACWSQVAASRMPYVVEALRKSLAMFKCEREYAEVLLPLSLESGDLRRSKLGCDRKALSELESLVDGKLSELAEKIYAYADKPFDIDDDEALGHFLFEHLGLLVPTRPKAGCGIGSDILLPLEIQHSVAKLVRVYRELSCFRHVFVEAFLADKRVEYPRNDSVFNLSIIAERRICLLNRAWAVGQIASLHYMLSVMDGLQCSDIRENLRDFVKKVIVPAESGHKFLLVNFEHCALRTLAFFAEDEVMARALEEDDVETAMAAQLFACPPEEVSLTMKRTTAQVAIRHVGVHWLALRLGIDEAEARQRLCEFNLKFQERFPKTWNYLEKGKDGVGFDTVYTTKSGVSGYLYETMSRNHDVRALYTRVASCLEPQASCADTLLRFCHSIVKNADVHQALPIFDNILMEVEAESAVNWEELVSSVVRECSWGVPFSPRILPGQSFYECLSAL